MWSIIIPCELGISILTLKIDFLLNLAVLIVILNRPQSTTHDLIFEGSIIASPGFTLRISPRSSSAVEGSEVSEAEQPKVLMSKKKLKIPKYLTDENIVLPLPKPKND